MKILVTYKSKTDFTKRYAEIIAKEVDYMQSGICYEKMSFANKTLMKMMSNVLSKKKNKDSAEEGFAQAIKSSYDISSPKYTEPLIKFLIEG